MSRSKSQRLRNAIRVCKRANCNFHGFTLQKGCLFGEDTKGFFVSFAVKCNNKMIIYRIDQTRINDIIWEPKRELIQDGTTAHKIYTYTKENPRFKIEYEEDNHDKIRKTFQQHVPHSIKRVLIFK